MIHYRIFKFIDDIKSKATNNAYFPFRDFADIKETLKKQWAGMLFDFLRQRREQPANQRIISLLTQIDIAGTKVEQIIGLIAENTLSPQKQDDLRAIGAATDEKRLLSILLDIWLAFRLNSAFLPEARKLNQDELERICSLLLKAPGDDKSSSEFIQQLQERLAELDIIEAKTGFVHFSIEFRLAELREANKRFKFKKEVMLKAIADSLVTGLETANSQAGSARPDPCDQQVVKKPKAQ